jgi:cytochrome c biogenesis protein CcdA
MMPKDQASVKRLVRIALGLVLVWTAALPAPASEGGEDTKVEAVFFYTPGCRGCAPTREAVRKAEARFGDRVEVQGRDLADPDKGLAHARELFALLDAHGVEATETPSLALFVGETYLGGSEEIIGNVREALARELKKGSRARRPEGADASAGDRLGFWAVTLAGLGDGVNPCAFATLVLLVSMLAAAGKSRRDVLLVGASFGLAVYITYFGIGLGLYRVLQHARGAWVVSDLIMWGAFLLCVVFAVLSLRDAWIARTRGREQAILLKLPDGLRERIRKRLRTGVRARHVVAASFGAGVVVSLFESLCTGQVYFPVLAGLARSEENAGRAVLLLCWYNGMFVLPLAGVFLATLLGVQSGTLATVARRRVAWAKVLLAGVFVFMAVWLSPELVWPPGAR